MGSGPLLCVWGLGEQASESRNVVVAVGVPHYQGRGIPEADMSRLMLALDSDTDRNPLNPRLYPRQ